MSDDAIVQRVVRVILPILTRAARETSAQAIAKAVTTYRGATVDVGAAAGGTAMVTMDDGAGSSISIPAQNVTGSEVVADQRVYVMKLDPHGALIVHPFATAAAGQGEIARVSSTTNTGGLGNPGTADVNGVAVPVTCPAGRRLRYTVRGHAYDDSTVAGTQRFFIADGGGAQVSEGVFDHLNISTAWAQGFVAVFYEDIATALVAATRQVRYSCINAGVNAYAFADADRPFTMWVDDDGAV